MNLTSSTNPVPYPEQFDGYPMHKGNVDDMSIKFVIPVFFHLEAFHHLRFAYLLGVGAEHLLLQSLILDFFNLYLVSIYVLHYRNPILIKSMKKVFWCFPVLSDAAQWQRLDDTVKT